MKKSIWSILVVMAALMLSSCGKDGNENDNQFGIYSAFVSDRSNPVPLTSTNNGSSLYLYSDGTYEVSGIGQASGRFGVNGSLLSLENFGQAIPVNPQEAGINGSTVFTGNFGTGTQNYGACIQINVTSAQFSGVQNYNQYNNQYNQYNNQNFNNQQNFGTNNLGSLAYFCR